MNAKAGFSIVLLLLLAGAVLATHATNVTTGIDFYSFWSVPTAQKLGGERLGSPYSNGQGYAEALFDLVQRYPDDPLLSKANAFWNRDPFHNRKNPSPLLFTVFAAFPQEYSRSMYLYRWMALFSFVGGMLLLGNVLRESALTGATLAAALILTFVPIQQDLRVLNVNCFLFAGLAMCLALTSVTERHPGQRWVYLRCLIGSALVFLALFKPVVLAACAFLGMYLLATASWHQRIAMIGIGMAAMALCVLVPCLFFGSCSVWQDWYGVISTEGLFYPLEGTGNSSLTMILVRWGLDNLSGASFVVAGTFVLLPLAVLVPFSSRHRLRTRLQQIWRDPVLLVSSGLLFTLAVSPLVWAHYYVLAIIPGLWLLKTLESSTAPALISVLFFIGSAEFAFTMLQAQGWGEVLRTMYAVGPIVLWLAILLHLRIDRFAI